MIASLFFFIMWHMCMGYTSVNISIQWFHDLWMAYVSWVFSASFSSRKNIGQKWKRSLTSVSKKSYWFFVIYSISQSVDPQQRRHVLSMASLFTVWFPTENICFANHCCCMFQFAGWTLCEVSRLPGISS